MRKFKDGGGIILSVSIFFAASCVTLHNPLPFIDIRLLFKENGYSKNLEK